MRWLMVYLVGFVTVCVSILCDLHHANAEQSGVQWSGNGHWYEAFSVPAGITWTAAKAAAESKGGYLASATSTEENTFIFNLVSDVSDPYKFWTVQDEFYGSLSTGPWLGGRQYDKLAEPAGHWEWLSGDPWIYTNWSNTSWTEEPNNGGGVEDWLGFMHLEVGGTGLHMGDTWNDFSYDNPFVISYVVEYVPEPSSFILLSAGGISLLAYILRRRKKTV